MNKFRSIFDKYIKDSVKRKRYMAFLLSLSMLVMFFVPLGLTENADSMTIDSSGGAILTEQLKYAPSQELANNAIDLSTLGEDFKASIYLNNQCIYSDHGYDINENMSIVSDTASLAFEFDYQVSDLKGKFSASDTKPHFYFPLSINSNDSTAYDLTCNAALNTPITDETWDSSRYAGYFSVIDGYVYITLTQDYINEKLNADDADGIAVGKLDFSGTLKANNNDDSGCDMNVGGKDIHVDLKLPPKQLGSLTKTGSLVTTGDNAGKEVKWTITLTKDAGFDLNGYYIEDAMFADSVTIKNNNGKNIGTYDSTNKKVTFNSDEDTTNATSITIEYTSTLTNSNIENLLTNGLKNTAYLKDSNGKEEKQDDETIRVNKPSINKTGSTDYSNGEGFNNEIHWDILITNNGKLNLDDYKIEDNMLKNAKNIKVTDYNGNEIAGASIGSDGAISGVGNRDSFRIKYTTDAKKGINENEAILKYGDLVVSNGKKEIEYKDESSLYTIEKTGSFDKDTRKITWNVKVMGVDGMKIPADYMLKDEAFSQMGNLNFVHAYVSSIYDDKAWDINSNPNNYYIHNGNTLTFKQAITGVEFTYTTDAGDNAGTQKNKVELDKPGETTPVKSVETSVEVEAKREDTFTKTVVSGGNQNIESNEEKDVTIRWKVTLTSDESFAGKSFNDILNDNGLASEIKNFTVQTRKTENGNYENLDASKYEITNNDGNGFTITFKGEDSDYEGIHYIDIYYDTVITLPAVKDADYTNGRIDYTIQNNGSGFGTGTGAETGIGRTNPNKSDKSVTIYKTWNSVPNGINDISVYLYTIVGNTRYYVCEENGKHDITTDSSKKKLFTVSNNNGSWNLTIENLPNSREIDGVKFDFSYYVVEDKIGNVNFVDNHFDLGNNGFVMKSESGTSITNKYYPEKSLSISKTWAGDTGTGDDVKSITVQVQRRPSGSQDEWANYGDPKTINKGELTEYSLGSFPTAEYQSNSKSALEYEYRVIETKITLNNDKEISATKVDDNTYRFIIESDYYEFTASKADLGGNKILTNTYHKLENITITANKEWYYENNKCDSFNDLIKAGADSNLTSIEFTLEYTIDNGRTWTKVEQNGIENPVTLTDGFASWKNLPTQKVNEDNTITVYKYRVRESGFTTSHRDSDDNSSDTGKRNITGDWIAASPNGGYYRIEGNNQELDKTGTVTIQNKYYPPSTISIKPEKVWDDNDLIKVANSNETDTSRRPESITFVLQQHNGTQWVDYTVNNKAITVTLTKANNWVGYDISNLPEYWMKKTTNSEGIISYTKEFYGYRFVEKSMVVKVNGVDTNYEFTPDENGWHANTVNASTPDIDFTDDIEGRYEYTITGNIHYTNSNITNTFTENIGIEKYSINNSGNKITSLDKDQLKQYKKKIDDVDYYVFNYVLEYNKKGNNMAYVEDTLPEGFTLVETFQPTKAQYSHYGTLDLSLTAGIDPSNIMWASGEKVGDGYYAAPMFFLIDKVKGNGNDDEYTAYIGYNASLDAVYGNYSGLYYYDGNRKVTFGTIEVTNADCTAYYGYSIKIECSKLEEKLANGNYSITNNASKNNQDKTPSGQTAKNTITIKSPTDLINKDVAETKIPGQVKYTIDVNPDAKILGNGSTIKIEDIFETTNYELRNNCQNHTHSGNYITDATRKKLVDVLLNSLTLYEYDSNGNRTKLDSSKYTYVFKSGTDIADAAAKLELNVPDGKHIAIEYTYKLLANENTPSVVAGCNSTTRQNGKFPVMSSGMALPVGDKISMSNTASLKTDSNSAEKKKELNNYEITKSSGTISTGTIPKIQKVNIADYTKNDLQADFLLAMYGENEAGVEGWYYATKIENKEVTWSSTPNTIPAGAYTISLDGVRPYEVNLSNSVIYKLIEVKVPEDYEGWNIGLRPPEYKSLIIQYLNDSNPIYNDVDYSNFLNTFAFEHYFIYNASPSSSLVMKPTSDPRFDTSYVMQVQTGGTVNVPNNELIDIGIEKNWIESDETGNKEIILQLYYSTENSAKMPGDAKIATAEELGIMDTNYTSVKTVKTAKQDKVWTNLPNGKGRDPIYYYVKEVGYKINGRLYMLDTDGNYKIAESYSVDKTTDRIEVTFANPAEKGKYYPTYIDNARDSDGTVIINNSPVLKLKKLWTDAENNELPADSRKIGTEEITVEIYGIDENGTKTTNPLFDAVTLTRTEKWVKDITDLIPDDLDFSKYTSFEVKETGLPKDIEFVTSCIFNINNNTGEITVTNKNPVSVNASVSVNKIWSDGNDIHTKDSIEVTLYQITAENAKGLSKNPTAEQLSNAKAVVYKPKDGEENTEVAYNNPVTLNNDNNWSHFWSGLPLDDSDEQSDGVATKEYVYYVVESDIHIDGDTNGSEANKYTKKVSLETKGSNYAYTITNERPSITVKKEWYDEEGNSLVIYDENGNLAKDDAPQDKVAVRIYKETKDVPADGLNIVALGDSITKGSYSATTQQVEEANRYPQKLDSKLSFIYSDIDVTVISQGADGESIPSFENRLGAINNDTDIVCLLGGTNDVSASSGMRIDDVDKIYEEMTKRLESLNSKIQDKNTEDKNVVIFIGTIPYFNYYDIDEYDNYTVTHGGGFWFNKASYTNWPNNNLEGHKAWAEHCNDIIDEANRAIKDFANNNDYIHLVDVNTALSDVKSLLIDGCHPNADGYDAIATAYANAIEKYYTVPEYLDANGKFVRDANQAKVYDITRDGEWSTIIDLPSSESKDTVYYVEEITNLGTNWEVSYKNNPKTILDSESVIVQNSYQPSMTNIEITKKWLNDEDDKSGRTNLAFRILRATNPNAEEWLEYEAIPDASSVKTGDEWTIKYSNLPVKDAQGNTYYYKIEEVALSDYTLVDGNLDTPQTAKDNTTLSFKATNTKSTLITVKKFWADGNDTHINDRVTVRLWRTLDQTKVDNALPLSLMVKPSGSITIGTNSFQTFDINKDDVTIELADNNANLTLEGKTIKSGSVLGKAKFIVKSADGKETVTIDVEVIPLSLEVPDTITAGNNNQTAIIKYMGSNVDADSFESDNLGVLTIDEDGKITAKDIGTATIIAKYTKDGVTYTVSKKVTVDYTSDFTLEYNGEVGTEIAPVEINTGESIELTPNMNYGEFEFTISNNGSAATAVTSAGKKSVTITAGDKEGTVTVTARRISDNKTATCVIKVIDAITGTFNYSQGTSYYFNTEKTNVEIKSIIIKNVKANGLYIEFFDANNSGGQGLAITAGNKDLVANYPNGKFSIKWDGSNLTLTDFTTPYAYIKFHGAITGDYEITLKNNAPATQALEASSYSLRSNDNIAILANEPEVAEDSEWKDNGDGTEYYDVEIVIKHSDNWEKVITNLPIGKNENQPYYYWIEEDGIPNYTASYNYNDIFDKHYISGTGGTVTIKNTPVTTFEGIEMPSTGGSGTTPYTTAGIMIAGGAVIALTIRRRKRKTA